MASSDCFVVLENTQGIHVKTFGDFSETEEKRDLEKVTDEVLYFAAKAICFSDCSDEEVNYICVGGREVRYCGWRPGMVYEFYDVKTRDIIWSRSFPHWDH